MAVNESSRAVEQTCIPKNSAFDAAIEDEERERRAYFDRMEKLTGVRPRFYDRSHSSPFPR